MNSKKVLTFSFLALFALISLSGFASANWWTETFQPFILSVVSPVGFDDNPIGVVVGILAAIVIFVILLDVAQLALPFSNWVNWVLAGVFVVVAGLLGFIRSVAGWALVLSATVAGTAGVLAMVISSVLLLLVIVFMFIGGNWIKKYIQHVKGGRQLLKAEQRGDTEAAKIAQGFRIGKRVGESAGTG